MTTNSVIMCIKWGNIFPPVYVNVLFKAVSANFNGNFRFICLTDDPKGLLSDIETYPIPDIGLTENQIRAPGVWRKLSIFHPSVALISPGARALFIDLDMMILGPIEWLLSVPGEIVLLDTGRDWRPSDPIQPSTGLFSFNLGEQSRILENFQSNPTKAISNFRNEQDFVASNATGLTIWPSGVVISFKRHLVRRYGRDLIFGSRKPYPGPIILAFHGDPRPLDILSHGIWGRFPHLGFGPVKWAREYWLSYGADPDELRIGGI